MADATNQVPIGDGLFTWPSESPRLLASRCRQCGSVSFPAIATCRDPECPSRDDVEVIELSPRGTLDAFTIMRYQPPLPWKGPESMVPFGQGFVRLPEGVSIVSVLLAPDVADLRVGEEMELVVQPLYTDEAGNEVMNYAFRLVPGSGGEDTVR